ncbi:hypothetical protein ACN3XK_02805 [Actinomadura welshii]
MNDDRRWLDEPRNVDRIVYGLYTLCALVFLADLLYTKHPHFGVEDVFGFYALYGFIGSVTLVLVAKQLRRVLMRPEDYYEPADHDERTGHDERTHDDG